MKTKRDPRHIERVKSIQALFAWEFNNKTDNIQAEQVLGQLEEVDNYIKKAAPMWPIDRINRLDLAILRVAVYELMVEKEKPLKVIVDEAIEIAKEYGSDSSPSFINGALGKLIQDYKIA